MNLYLYTDGVLQACPSSLTAGGNQLGGHVGTLTQILSHSDNYSENTAYLASPLPPCLSSCLLDSFGIILN